MKIVTWNCAGAFRKKYELLTPLDADLLVVQECENPTNASQMYREWAENFLWVGEKHKGLGIFARNGITLEKLEWANDGLKYFLACSVNGIFNLVAVWTKAEGHHDYRYIGQFWKYLQVNKEKFESYPIVICGDFNSNAIWDKEHKGCSHSDVVNQLSKLGIESIYHRQKKEIHGQETTYTFYMHRNVLKPYHIDYAFASQSLIDDFSPANFGEIALWALHSDHVPLIFNINVRQLVKFKTDGSL